MTTFSQMITDFLMVIFFIDTFLSTNQVPILAIIFCSTITSSLANNLSLPSCRFFGLSPLAAFYFAFFSLFPLLLHVHLHF